VEVEVGENEGSQNILRSVGNFCLPRSCAIAQRGIWASKRSSDGECEGGLDCPIATYQQTRRQNDHHTFRLVDDLKNTTACGGDARP
jgi:hypothetical protein